MDLILPSLTNRPTEVTGTVRCEVGWSLLSQYGCLGWRDWSRRGERGGLQRDHQVGSDVPVMRALSGIIKSTQCSSEGYRLDFVAEPQMDRPGIETCPPLCAANAGFPLRCSSRLVRSIPTTIDTHSTQSSRHHPFVVLVVHHDPCGLCRILLVILVELRQPL